MTKPVKVLKLEGFKVFFDDGSIVRKDPNTIWLYQLLTPWENRQWYTDKNGRLELHFP